LAFAAPKSNTLKRASTSHCIFLTRLRSERK
jgi:hypothetical protein